MWNIKKKKKKRTRNLQSTQGSFGLSENLNEVINE